jgi:hypothetical protein
MYVVIFDATLHGSSVMSTEDTVEAATPADADPRREGSRR